MTRISRATLFGLPIDSLDEMLAKVDAVSVDELTELRPSSTAPSASRPPASAATRTLPQGAGPVSEALVAA